MSEVGDRLEAVRSDPTRRRVATAAGVTVGLAAAWVHWIGFLLGGMLVGLAAVSLRRALAAGVAFGLVGWGVFVLLMAGDGLAGKLFATGSVVALTVAIPLAGGAVGSLARGLV